MPPPRGFVQRLDQALHRRMLLPTRARLLVAVSGGADSVALLRLLHAINQSDYWHWTLVIAHVDHGIRGKASTEDAAFVKALGKQLRLPVLSKTLRLGKSASENDAREARLKTLTAMCKAKKCVGVVMGHHADDHAETVLMKLFRGAGLDGLAGIAESSNLSGLVIYRPLLTFRRDELRQYLNALGQPWREDNSNATDAYARNRLRRLMPEIEKTWPGAVLAIARMSDIVHHTQRPIRDLAHFLWQTHAVVTGRKNVKISLPRDVLQTWEALVAEVLRIAVKRVGGTTETADSERIHHAVHLILNKDGGKHVEMGRGVTVHIGKMVVIERKQPAKMAAKMPKKKT